MKKELIFILMILLVIAGCKRATEIYEPEKIEYHIGTEGLVIDIVKGMPPDTVFEKTEFMVGVELKNKGAYDISNGVVVIAGLDPKYTKIDKEEEFFDMPGKSPGYPEGGYEIMHFKLQNVWFPIGKEEQRIPFTIVADYDYQTEAKVEVCINPDIYSYVKTKETGCEVKDVKISKGQGAPLAITLVEPAISLVSYNLDRLDVRFGIYIENKGKGNVIGDITIKEAKLGNKRIECSKVRKEKLIEDSNKWYVSCSTAMEKPGEAYISPLILTFNYEYRTRQNKEVTVKTITK